MTVQSESIKSIDASSVLHPYTDLNSLREQGPFIVERGEGIYVYDDNGNKYIEATGALWYAALGFGENELVEAAIAQMRKLPCYHTFYQKSTAPPALLAERLVSMAPGNMSRAFFTNSGSEAIDSAIKTVWYYNNSRGLTAKKKFIARHRAYHGVTIASCSLTGIERNHLEFDLPLPFVRHVTCPHFYREGLEGETESEFCDRLIAEIEQTIIDEGADTVAAFIAEPVMAAGGVVVPPERYFEKLMPVLKRHDILMIADEVVCGFGRTGQMFGSQTFGIDPDIVIVAKALSSGYLPIASMLVSEDICDGIADQSKNLGSYNHGFTYSGHPVSSAVALRNLELYEERNLMEHVNDMIPLFRERLKATAELPLVGEARGVGLIGGIELVADKTTRQPFDPARKIGLKCSGMAENAGIIIRPMGDALALCPPLIIKEDEINQLFDGLEATIRKLGNEL